MPSPRSSQRFPVRTLVLMILALAAFIWMWTMTHSKTRHTVVRGGTLQVEPMPPPPGPPPLK